MTPATYDFALVRGTTSPLVVRLKTSDGATPPVLTNLVFDSVHLTINKRATLLLRKDLGDAGFLISDAGNAEVTWTPTPTESRLIPIGSKATYELEVRNGSSQEVYLMGTITGIGGINDD